MVILRMVLVIPKFECGTKFQESRELVWSCDSSVSRADEFRGGTSAGGVTGDVTGLELAEVCQQSHISVTGCNTDTLKEVRDVKAIHLASVLEYVAPQPLTGLPPYWLHLKVGTICHLLHNLSIAQVLVKNSCVVIVGLGNHLISVHLLHNI